MILEDLVSRIESVDRQQLDELLAELCELLVAVKRKDNDFFELIAAGVLDPSNRFVIGINFKHKNGQRVHAERAAIERYKKLFGPIPKGSIIVTTLSPCNRPMEGRYGESCVDLIRDEGIKYVYCGYKDPTQDTDLSVETTNPQLKTLCRAFTKTFLDPNHIDEDQEEYAGITVDYRMSGDSKYFYVKALSGDGSRELGSVDFTNIGDGWEGDHLWVDDRYRGQGIATAMYDFAKEKLCKIVPSQDRTDDGLAFWRGKEVWEDTQPSKSKEFIKKVYDQYPDWPYGQADKVMVWGEGDEQQFAAFKLKPGVAADTVEIDWIMAGPEQRKGVGSRAIKELQRQAQEAGIKLTLYPWAKGNVSQASLTKLYKRHGFKPIAKGAKPMSWEPSLSEESNKTAISLTRLPQYHKGGEDSLGAYVPERLSHRFALDPNKWESTFFSLTNKDPRKLKYYGPREVEIVPGTLIADMAIANQFYRTKDPEERKKYAQEYKDSLKPYTGDTTGYRFPELLIPNTLNELKIDNVHGLGSVPWNQEVDYMGLRVMMKPSMFLKLALPLNKSTEDAKTIDYLEQHKDDEGFGAPFLQVDMNRDFPRITGHDGRHRMEAVLQSEGDHPVEVHIFPRGMRNRDMTPEVVDKLNDLVISQDGKYTVGPLFTQQVNEVIKVPTITKKKTAHLDVLPNDGKPIPRGETEEYLGTHVGDIRSDAQVWTYRTGNFINYIVYNPETRISHLACSGTRYPNNPNSLIIHGLYSGPKNDIRASSFYYWLIKNLGLTLVSDYKQSEGGHRVWQDLEKRYGKFINIHGFNTKTNEPINVGARDDTETHIPYTDIENAPAGMRQELASLGKDVRLVASPK